MTSLTLKLEEIQKGLKVIIRSNRHSLMKRDIIGIIEKEPQSWTHILVRYFDPQAGDLDENNDPKGDWVVKDFILTHLERATSEECAKMVRHYKRLALEFHDLYKEITGRP